MTARQVVRTKEAGELGIATLHIQQTSVCARGVDFGMMHEDACHNREKNGTTMTDFSQTVTTRQTHGCDLLAGDAGQQGRSHELDFYGALRPQERAPNFVPSAGVLLFRDLFEQVGRLAQRTRMTRCLYKESRQPESQRSKVTRVMWLMEKGDVDGNHWKEVCKHLSGNLKAEAMRSQCLGQITSSSSSLNLSTLTDYADVQSIQNILKLGECERPCHFCAGGPDSRVH